MQMIYRRGYRKQAGCKTDKGRYKNFLADKLALELSDEKTLVTHTERAAKFLGYEITVRKSNDQRRDKRGRLRRTYGKRVCLNVSTETVRKNFRLGVWN